MHAFREVLKRDPKDAKALGLSAQTPRANGRVDEALHISTSRWPMIRNSSAWSAKGHALAKFERYQDALVCFQKAHNLATQPLARYVEQCRRSPANRRTSSWMRRQKQPRMAHRSIFQKPQTWRRGPAPEGFHVTRPVSDSIQKNAAAWFNMGHSIGFLVA